MDDPYVVVGLLIGGMLPYLFGSMGMTAVGRTSEKIVNEVRRQFAENKVIMTGRSKPEYGKVVDILTKGAIPSNDNTVNASSFSPFYNLLHFAYIW